MTESALRLMSFRRSGKIADITRDLSSGRAGSRLFDDLVTLGHVERTGESGWRIAPPVLAGLPQNSGAAAVLCGARTPALLESLDRASSGAGAQISFATHENLPATVTMTAPTQDLLAEAAAMAGLKLQAEAGLCLLACTPSIKDWPRTPCPMVEGKVETVRRFSRSQMRWVPSTLDEAARAAKGFFRIKRDWDWVSLVKSSPSQASLIDDRAGRLSTAVKCKVVKWTRVGGILTLPAQLYPPSIMARGLALCSGHVPSFDREAMQITFTGVQQDHLSLFLALTGLRLT